MSKLSYRADIDGLRAIAVMSVFLFHINELWVPGGFTGVDIFFTISGFLITSISFKELQNNSFSLKDFYVRRMKRIFPLMWFVMVVSLICGILIFPPGDLKFLVNSMRSALSFTSNHFFAQSGDYFNSNSSQWTLLHMWSLSVEEQFYFIWPFLLLGLFKIKSSPKFKIGISALIAIVSFIACEVYMRSVPDHRWAYYALPFRFGELLFGAVMGMASVCLSSRGILGKSSYHNVASVLGLILMGLSFYGINSKTLFPGFYSLLPCAAGVLLLVSEKSFFNQRVLSSKVFRWIGQHSYSIYLWHWPVLAFMRYFGVISNVYFLLSIIVTFALSLFSKKYIEDNFRRTQKPFGFVFARYYVMPAMAFLLLIIPIYDSGGFPARYYLVGMDPGAEQTHDHYCDDLKIGTCLVGDKNKEATTLLFGDSHGRQFHGFLNEVGKHDGFSVKTLAQHACFPSLVNEQGESEECAERKSWFVHNISSYSTVIIAARWDNKIASNATSDEIRSTYSSHIRKTFEFLAEKKVKVILIPQVIKYLEQDFSLLAKTRYSFLGYGEYVFGKHNSPAQDPAVAEANKIIVNIAKDFSNIQVFNPIEIVGTDIFPFYDKWLMYLDSNHLNDRGSIIVATKYLEKRKVKDDFSYRLQSENTSSAKIANSK